MRSPQGWILAFQEIDDYISPVWPWKTGQQRHAMKLKHEKHVLRVCHVIEAIAKYKPACIWLVAHVNEGPLRFYQRGSTSE